MAQVAFAIARMEEDENNMSRTSKMLESGDNESVRLSGAAEGVPVEMEDSLPGFTPTLVDDDVGDSWNLEEFE